MTQATVKISPKIPSFATNRAFVIGVAKFRQGAQLVDGLVDTLSIRHLNLQDIGSGTALEKFARTPAPKGSIFLLAGLGEGQLTNDSLRSLAGGAVRELSTFAEIVFDIPTESAQQALAIAEGALLGDYAFDSYLSKKSNRPATRTITVLSQHRVSAAQIESLQVTTEAVHITRDLVNTPANDLYPQAMAKLAQKYAKGLALSVEVWDEKQLRSGGFGGLVAVGAGSARPPRLVKISYTPKGAKKHLALVGKGITFDTGGLSLKPGEAMVGMKYDMTGAASVMNAIVAVAKLGLNTRVTAWLCLAENMPSGTATRPNDIIKIRNGKTVEVLNTDAEGRLVLADGLSIASEEKPDYIVDVATLTGAAVIALGTRYAGLMGDDAPIEIVQRAAKEVGELVWPMPLPAELRPLLNSDIADIANVKIGNRAGGMLVGGHFLKEFIGSGKTKGASIPWVHIDIAGPSDNSGSAYGYTPKGATGNIVRTLIETARALQN
jgi:leucyl aminopeptidase